MVVCKLLRRGVGMVWTFDGRPALARPTVDCLRVFVLRCECWENI